VNLDGSNEVRLTNSGTNRDPAWSPDGARMVFASDRTGFMDLYVMDADGSNIIRRGFTAPTDPAWSPDGQKIAFASLCDGQGCILTTSADEDGSSPDRVGHPAGQHLAPAWSPDGTRIAFVSDWVAFDFVFDIYVTKIDGSEITQLTQGFGMWPYLQYFLHPAWSPDGSKIAFVYGSIINASDMRFKVAVMQTDGTGKQDLAWAGDIPWMNLLDPGSIAWSPDGSRIAFSFVDCDLATQTGCTDLRSIKYVTVDGSEEGLIVSDGHSPSWRR
jgi:TolB protein